MAEIVIAVAGKVSEYLVAPIGRQLGYLFCYRSHAEKLRNQVQKLRTARNDQQITVDEATRKGDEIRPTVREWLNEVDQITGEAEAFVLMTDDQNVSCLNGWCPNLITRYQLGREAYKKAQVIVGMQTARNFPDGISYSVLPRSATFKGYECFQSRDSTLNDIMDALKDDKTKVIGVCGMGGLGKTMLVKQVAQQAKQHNLFTTDIFIDVSWTRDSKKDEEGIAKIQQKTADMLGFQFRGKDESTRADELKQRLQKKKEPEKENQSEKEKEQKKEKILIILDDMWKKINLEKVGIPFTDDQTICKLVLVSRDANLLLKDMGVGAQKCFRIQPLQGEEAWHLLKNIAGDFVEGDQLRPTVIKVLDVCGGLPIAIVTIATALKDENVAAWKNALDELRSCAPINIRGMEENVYSCLEWSYNRLKGDEVKSLFLLCGCLSYYGDISMDQMLRYATGLNFFDRIDSLEGAIYKLVTLVKTLKASSLLLDGTEDDGDGSGVGASRLLFMDGDHKSVRMHDLVRDVARIIASQDPHQFKVVEDVPFDQDWTKIEDESKFISLYCKAVLELPPRLVCPKLQFFILQRNSDASLNTIPNTFFEGMSQLKVLALFGMYFPTLPSTLRSLANLRTLNLDRCKLGDMAIIGELKKLQVLSMVGSDIQHLPREMMQLTNLRLLDLNYCEELKVIPRDILSSLSRLECLFMKSSFSEWAVDEVSDGDSNACLSELNNLHSLRTIEVKIPNTELVPKADIFGHNLTSYAIFIGSFDELPETYEKSKTLHLKGGDESLLSRDGIRKLLRTTEELQLWGLEVCGGPILVSSFDNLKTLVVRECHGLKILFLLSMGRDLPQLEEMTIEDCNEMQQIMEDDHVGFNLQLRFPKLRSLKLGSLPKLVNFGYFSAEMETTSEAMCSQGNPDINMSFFNYQVFFSNLEILQLDGLPKIKEIWHHQLPLDSFSNLRILSVVDCEHLLNLIPRRLIQSFKNLKEIEVELCWNLRHVFDVQGCDDVDHVEIFSKSKETSKLENLVEPKDISICDNEKNESSGGCLSCFSPFRPVERSSIFCPGKEDKDPENVNISNQDGVHFLEEVLFSNLEKLVLYGLGELKEIWHHRLPHDSFSNLRILKVYKCENLLNIIPCHLIQSFKNLKEIYVNECRNLKHVFDLQGCDTYGEILPKLEILELYDLEKLKGIIIDNNEENDNTRGLFSLSMPMTFQNLKCLSIDNCGEEVEDGGNVNIPIEEHEVLFGEKVSFPNLEELALNGLSMLKKIWHPQHRFSDKLRILSVGTCPRLASLSPSHLIHNFQNLKELDVYNCEVLEYVFDHQGLNSDDGILLKIEILKLEELPKLRLTFYEDKNDNMPYHLSLSKFTALEHIKELHIINCGKPLDEKVSFSPNLEVLVLERFSKLKKIDFGTEPKLGKLVLKELPKLSNILSNGDENASKRCLLSPYEDKNDNMPHHLSLTEFTALEHIKKLHIINCGNLLDEKVSFSPNLEVLVLERFSKLKKIDFGTEPKLRKLVLNKLPKLSNILSNGDENAIKNRLLSPSTFKNFHNLKELDITNCGMEDRRDDYTPANGVEMSTEILSFLGGVSNYEAFESRASSFNKIMDALRDENVYSIGVVGIGGVGKTTLVKQVAQQAMQHHLFTTQVYFDLSSTRHSSILQVQDIQSQIAEMLGWGSTWWYQYEPIRAVEMKKRLKSEKILIILDNIWREIDLEQIRIPSCKDDDVKECKIVFTCRDEELLYKGMGAQICFPVETLPPKEAWTLFNKTASVCDSMKDNQKLRSVATQVVEKCEGLPLAIVTIAKALKDETMVVWENALEQLKDCAASKTVNSCLEWCYTHLKQDDLKSLLLLCGSLSYDGDISMDHLLQYAMGLDLFDRVDSLEQARNRLLALVEILKDSSWLLEDHRPQDRSNFDEQRCTSLLFTDRYNKFMRMHDVVSDVVREIASKDPHPFIVRQVVGLEEWSETNESKNCTFISVHCKAVDEQLPQVLVCPKLHFFLLHKDEYSLNIPNTFFQGMKKLKVLDLSKMDFEELPSSLNSLANLRTLRLDECYKLKDIAGIGKLTKLQVLSLAGSGIQGLLDEMAQLSNLRLLNLNNCKELKVIPRNILSSLSRLECLDMTGCSNSQWAAVEGDHINANACLSDLNHLSCLTTLSITIPDVELLPKDVLFDNLTRYAILIGNSRGFRTNKALKLHKVNRGLDFGDGIIKLLERSEELLFSELSGTKFLLSPSNRMSFAELKHLDVRESSDIQYIIDSTNQQFMEQGAFPLLESLFLWDLKNLEEVWHGPIPIGPFGNLKTLEVYSCPKLRYLFWLSTARGLSLLESMKIKKCKAMQQVIAYGRESEDKDDGTNLELFPNLQTLKLINLPQLISFCSKSTNEKQPQVPFFNHKVSFSKLERLKLRDLPKLKPIELPEFKRDGLKIRI